MSEAMVVIRSYSSEFEAHLAIADLRASGIPARMLTDGLGGVHPHLQFARGVRVAVPESMREEAITLLDTPPEEESF